LIKIRKIEKYMVDGKTVFCSRFYKILDITWYYNLFLIYFDTFTFVSKRTS